MIDLKNLTNEELEKLHFDTGVELIERDSDAFVEKHGGTNKERIHAAHCCTEHGCKYGDDDCPVVSNKVTQMYPCIDCSYTE